MSVQRVGVAGAGTMGAGIAQIACLGGLETALHDPMPEALATGADRVRQGLEKGAERGRWSHEEAEAAAGRLRPVSALEELAGSQLVIEAAPEDLSLKHELFTRLAEACGPETVLASNTSSLSVTAIQARIERPERVCGMHFFNPPPLMRLVEIVAGEETSDEALEIAEEVARRMGREPVRAADGIGFLANRVARPFLLEGPQLVGAGISTPEQVDRICRLGGGFRMGPFELADLVGVDVNFAVARSFWEQGFGEARWRPHPLQARLVEAGHHGRKAGRGWYDYREGPHRADDPPAPEPTEGAPDASTLGSETIEDEGFRAIRLERGSLTALAPGDDAVGFVALPDLASAGLVELTRGQSTSEGTASAAEQFFRALGKHVEWVGDAPGLVLGRILCQLVNEAHFAAGEGVGTPKDIDTAMRLGYNHPRGPFEWAEAIGAARVLAVIDALHSELGEERYRPAPGLRRAAAAGSPHR